MCLIILNVVEQEFKSAVKITIQPSSLTSRDFLLLTSLSFSLPNFSWSIITLYC